MKRARFFYQVMLTVACLLLIGSITSCDVPTSSLSSFDSGRRDCVVMLGDSIFDLSKVEPNTFENLAGFSTRHYFQNGAQMNGGTIVADIKSQLNRAIRAGQIRTIIMDGGGNDFLLGTRNVARLNAELEEAWRYILETAANAGVENIVVQGYYKTSTATDAMMADAAELGDRLEAKASQLGMKLVYYNPAADPYFSSKRPVQYTAMDGIHPNTAAAQHMARQLWDLMVANDIEQDGGC